MTLTPNRRLRGLLAGLLLTLSLNAARAADASEASEASVLPVALSATATSLLVAGATELTVVGVQASADGTTWLLERAADGSRASVRLAGQASVATGSTLVVTAVAAGWLLSQAGRVLALVPNDRGLALLAHQRVSP